MAAKGGKSKAKLQRRRPVGTGAPLINTRRTFDRAYRAFFEEDDPDQALTLLQQIEAQGYMSLETMRLYLDVLHELRDFDQYARIATILAVANPSDPDANLWAASGAIATAQLVSALLYFERFIKLAPQHPEAAIATEQIAKLRRHLPEILDSFIDDLPKDLPRVASTEKILHLFKLGRFDDVIKRADEHLKTYPADLRIRNNLAEVLALKGDVKKALKIVHETLNVAPDNMFALAVRCRLEYFQGNSEIARSDAKKLVNLQPRLISDLTKAAQSFAYLGDDDGIRWAYQEAEKREWLSDPSTDVALLTNYYATSLARAGNTAVARTHWKYAVKLAGDSTTAQDNLDDLRQPPGKQWGPSYFDLRDWFSQTQLYEIREISARVKTVGDEERSVQSLHHLEQRFLSKYPEFERSIPAMLDRGNEESQRFAVMLAPQSRLPNMKEVLREYACGPRGNDEIRFQVLTRLKEQGFPLEPPLSMYTKGTVQQIELINFEITDEPSVPEGRTEETCEMIDDAITALHEGHGEIAERILRQVRQYEPEEPDVLNNLAMALQLQNRMDEADVLIDEVIEKYPDYFFGKINKANRYIHLKQYDEALDILVELQRYKQLHRTEFLALAKSLIRVYVEKQEHASADRWLDMLRHYEPDNPNLESLEQYVSRRKNMRPFWKKIFAR
jgi:tetratricopeptide (TPR) repeat protein